MTKHMTKLKFENAELYQHTSVTLKLYVNGLDIDTLCSMILCRYVLKQLRLKHNFKVKHCRRN